MRTKRSFLQTIVLVLFIASAAAAQGKPGVRPTDTGGPLMFEQAVFDLQSYEGIVRVDPGSKSIAGSTIMIAKTGIPTNVIVLDLYTPYNIEFSSDGSKSSLENHSLKYQRTEG